MGNRLCCNRVPFEQEQNHVLWVSFMHPQALNLEQLASALRAKSANSEPAWRPALFADIALVTTEKIQSQLRGQTHNYQLVITLIDGQGALSKQDLTEVERVVRNSFPFLDNMKLSAGEEFRIPFYYRSQVHVSWETAGHTNNVHSEFGVPSPAAVQSERPTRTWTAKSTFCGIFGVCACFPRLTRITDVYE